MLLGLTYLLWLKILFASFNGILFTQSGLNKLFDYRGNLSYFQDHFKNSPLKGMAGLLLPIIMLIEVSAGLCSLAGVVFLLVGIQTVAPIGLLLGATAVTCLFLGQRLAQDYAGAAALVPYFLMTSAGLVLFALS